MDDIEAAVQAAMQMHKTGCDIAQQHDRGTEYDVCIRCEKHREAVGQAIQHVADVARAAALRNVQCCQEYHDFAPCPVAKALAEAEARLEEK